MKKLKRELMYDEAIDELLRIVPKKWLDHRCKWTPITNCEAYQLAEWAYWKRRKICRILSLVKNYK